MFCRRVCGVRLIKEANVMCEHVRLFRMVDSARIYLSLYLRANARFETLACWRRHSSQQANAAT